MSANLFLVFVIHLCQSNSIDRSSVCAAAKHLFSFARRLFLVLSVCPRRMIVNKLSKSMLSATLLWHIALLISIKCNIKQVACLRSEWYLQVTQSLKKLVKETCFCLVNCERQQSNSKRLCRTLRYIVIAVYLYAAACIPPKRLYSTAVPTLRHRVHCDGIAFKSRRPSVSHSRRTGPIHYYWASFIQYCTPR